MNRKLFLLLFMLFASISSMSAQTKCEASINGYHIRTIYIMGGHYNAVVWAYKHIAEESCLTPVQDPAKADAILELYDPSAERLKTPDNTPLTVSCTSGNGSSFCTDSDGNMMTTSCTASGCSSYYGPNPAHEIGQALSSWVHNASYQGEARIYTPDKKLLWRSVDQKKDHWSDLWVDKVREGTNSPGCEGRNWSVTKDAHKYKNYRRWASEKCGIEMPPFVAIDLKLQAKLNAVDAKELEKQQMIENAKEAAAQQQKQ